MTQPLLSPASVALSLAPPRTPPHGSVLRNLYINPNHHGHGEKNSNDLDGNGGNPYQSHTLTSRLLQLFAPHYHLRNLALHPHLPSSLSFPDKLTRFLGAVLPLEYQHSGRDNGYFKSIADGMVTLTCPLVGVGHWQEARDFLELSYPSMPRAVPSLDRESSSLPHAKYVGLKGGLRLDGKRKIQRGRRRGWGRERISYGDHSMQFFDLFLPSNDNHSNDENTASDVHSQSSGSYNKTSVRGTIFFVHGGAWGSGQPWMYRLVAPVFLKLNFAVVVVGYRTYPEAPTIDDQCEDVRSAWDKCEHVLNELVVPAKSRDSSVGDDGTGWVGNVICGHSSGAHVALLMLVDMIGEQMENTDHATTHRIGQNYPWVPDYFVGLSGPYDISYHFDFEGGRGVEQISPMKPICGHSRENFDRASPVKRLLSLFGKQREGMTTTSSTIQQLTPPILLVHGIEDSTVPFTATADAGRILRSCGLKQCDEIYLEETNHQDVIMHFMLGGPAKDSVLNWLLQCSQEEKTAQIQSRL